MAACGGVLRDHYGAFVQAFSRKIGVCSALQAELWGILWGLRYAHRKGISHVFIESDSSSSISLMSSGCDDSHPCAPLVREIQSTLLIFTQVRWGHIFREANSVANALAK